MVTIEEDLKNKILGRPKAEKAFRSEKIRRKLFIRAPFGILSCWRAFQAMLTRARSLDLAIAKKKGLVLPFIHLRCLQIIQNFGIVFAVFFRPWWDTLEDYLLNTLIMLGKSEMWVWEGGRGGDAKVKYVLDKLTLKQKVFRIVCTFISRAGLFNVKYEALPELPLLTVRTTFPPPLPNTPNTTVSNFGLSSPRGARDIRCRRRRRRRGETY